MSDESELTQRKLDGEPVEPLFQFIIGEQYYPIDLKCLTRLDFRAFREQFKCSFQEALSLSMDLEKSMDVVAWLFHRLIIKQSPVNLEQIEEHLSIGILNDFFESLTKDDEEKKVTPAATIMETS